MPARRTRRDALRAGGTALLAGFAGCIAAPGDRPSRTRDGGDWPQFGADPANTGHAPDARGPGADAVDWQFDLGAATGYASPVLVGETVYAAGTGNRGTVRALDAGTGVERWSFEPTGWASSAPVYADGRLYVATWKRRCYALDAADGTVAWETDLGHRVSAPPTVVDGTVFVGTDGDGPLSADDPEPHESCALVALDAGTGDEEWRYDRFGRREGIEAAPAVADGRVVFGTDDGALVALDATTGQERWRLSRDASIDAAPAVADDTVYVAFEGGVRALDVATGERRWLVAAGGVGSASPAVADGTVYVAATRHVGCPNRCDDAPPNEASLLTALDATTGDRQWRHRSVPVARSAPAVVDGTVYFGRRAGVEAVDATTGESRWSVAFDEGKPRTSVESSPAVGRGRLYLSTRDGVLYAVGDG